MAASSHPRLVLTLLLVIVCLIGKNDLKQFFFLQMPFFNFY